MEKNAYLVVSDLHCYYKSFSGRHNYRDEMDHVQLQLIEIARKYKKLGYNIKLLLLGDVFHSSYKDVFKAVKDSSFFIMWREAIGEIYTVLGNHELTYYDANPFYCLVTEIESDKILHSSARVLAPMGTMSVIRVVDKIDDGYVHFHFNHFGTEITCVKEDDGVNIGLFHQEIVNDAVLDYAKDAVDQNIYVTKIMPAMSSVLDGYKYSFFGHMHKIYGTWKTGDDSYLCYLASLGRTNVTEVSDSFLERNVPVVLVENGELVQVEDNKFLLMSRESCVNEVYVQESKKTYETIKTKKEIKSYLPDGDNPVENLYTVFMEYPAYESILQGLLKSDVDDLGFLLESRVKKEVFNDKF